MTANIRIDMDNAAFEANACLIAAAPDLLEAAKHALAWMDDTYGKFPAESEAGSTSAMLRAAIAKAEAR